MCCMVGYEIEGKCSFLMIASPSGVMVTYVAIEGFVFYAGGDYGLHLNVMLLVQIWLT